MADDLQQNASMSLGQHLEELRFRILIALGTVAALFMFVFLFFHQSLITLLKNSVESAIGSDVVLRTLSPAEVFLVSAKVSFATAIAFSLPVVLWQIWRFVSPGLQPRERKLFYPVITAGTLLFMMGMLICYFAVLPTVFRFFTAMNASVGTEIAWSLASVIDTQITMLLAFGIGFETPLIILLLTHLGIVSPAGLAAQRKYVFLATFALSAVLTPPDPASMLLLAGPLYLLFEASIAVARILKHREARTRL